MKKNSYAGVICAVALCMLCGSCALGVDQWQREFLSDPTMRFDAAPDKEKLEQHLLPVREGSSGGYGGAGGGCGC